MLGVKMGTGGSRSAVHDMWFFFLACWLWILSLRYLVGLFGYVIEAFYFFLIGSLFCTGILNRLFWVFTQSGFAYLRATASQHRVFKDLFNLSSFLIPKDQLPELPEDYKRTISFAELPASGKKWMEWDDELIEKKTKKRDR
jgi:hypothetical protein